MTTRDPSNGSVTSRFQATTKGSLVGPVFGLDRTILRGSLPPKLRRHSNVEAFLDAVESYAAGMASMADQTDLEEAATAASVRDDLNGVEVAAHRMQHALSPLSNASVTFDVLATQFAYLAHRARDRGEPIDGRPVVPFLPPDVPGHLAALLARIDTDLQTLRIACSHAATKIRPERSQQKSHARLLVLGIAELYRAHFAAMPPKRGLFADAFVEHIAQAMGWSIGHRVVGEVVASLR